MRYLKVVKFTETENRMVVARGSGVEGEWLWGPQTDRATGMTNGALWWEAVPGSLARRGPVPQSAERQCGPECAEVRGGLRRRQRVCVGIRPGSAPGGPSVTGPVTHTPFSTGISYLMLHVAKAACPPIRACPAWCCRSLALW